MLLSRECVKSAHQSPFVRVYLFGGRLKRFGTEMGVGVTWDDEPLTLLPCSTPPASAVWHRRGKKVDQVTTEKDPDSFWSQCGNMSSQEGAEIIRRGRNHREEGGGGGGETTCKHTIKGGRCGTAPSPQSSCSTGQGNPLFSSGPSIEF